MGILEGKYIAVVDDEEGIRFALKKLLVRQGAEVSLFSGGAGFIEELGKKSWDGVVIDLRLSGGESGIDLLKRLHQEDNTLPAVMITGYGTIASAVEAMKAGAFDFVLKPIDNSAMVEILARAIEVAGLQQENRYLRQRLKDWQFPSSRFITKNETTKALLAIADRVKHSDASILILGESGTGKEVLASHIHYSSRFGEAPFISLNCAALDENLLASELFGHEKGAFTGAVERKQGKLELVNGGTLFLDEIGDMALSVQARFLRVLEERTFQRVGGSRNIHSNFRLLCATNKDLEQMMKEDRFREDLYYRIRVVTLELLPLRKRPEDIVPLADFFTQFFSERYGKEIASLSPSFLEVLKKHLWPGNIRELRNVINQAVLLSEGKVLTGQTNCLESLIEPVARDSGNEASLIEHLSWDSGFDLLEVVERESAKIEKELIRQALVRYRGNKSELARKLRITRKTLARKLEKLQLDT